MALTSLSSLCRPLALLLLALATTEATQLQAQAEEVTFSGIYNFFTNELIIRRFYVIIIFQVLQQAFYAIFGQKITDYQICVFLFCIWLPLIYSTFI